MTFKERAKQWLAPILERRAGDPLQAKLLHHALVNERRAERRLRKALTALASYRSRDRGGLMTALKTWVESGDHLHNGDCAKCPRCVAEQGLLKAYNRIMRKGG